MADETKNSKWEGKASAELQTTTGEQIWPLLEDFCNLHKLLPTLDTCRHVEGVYGQPGLVRYCATVAEQPSNVVKWCHEKLVSIDPNQRRLSYEIGENNLGFSSYVAELKVVETDDGCRVEWWFSLDPVDGMRYEDLWAYVEASLKGMVERMEKELQAVPN